MARVVVNIPDSVDLSKVNDIKLCIRYCKDNDEYSYVTDGFSIQEERPQGDCENCDFRKFSEKFIDGVVEVMNKNGITSVEQLSEILKGGAE